MTDRLSAAWQAEFREVSLLKQRGVAFKWHPEIVSVLPGWIHFGLLSISDLTIVKFTAVI